MYEYEVEICPTTGRHTVVTTWATCEDTAVLQVCKAFKCPESICKVTQQTTKYATNPGDR